MSELFQYATQSHSYSTCDKQIEMATTYQKKYEHSWLARMIKPSYLNKGSLSVWLPRTDIAGWPQGMAIQTMKESNSKLKLLLHKLVIHDLKITILLPCS